MRSVAGALKVALRREAGALKGAPARKARALALPPRASVRELAHAAIAEGRAHFLQNARRLSSTHDAELVHQTRVALRRLRVFVRLFRSRIGRERAARLIELLRWLFEPLGELRDLQNFARACAPRAGVRVASSAAFELRLRRRLEAASRTLNEALASPRFGALSDALASLEHELAADHPDKRARRWLARRLDKRRQRALRYGAAVLERDLRELHDLRKELKRLRYAAELARDLRPARKHEAREYLRRLRALQDVLGALLDAEVARSLLGSLLEDVHASSAHKARLGARGERRAALLLADLTPCFERFAQAEPFWS
jgi:triphosphatase